MSKFNDFWKKENVVEKPGDSSHTAKWDRCVEHVKANGSNANAFAVCTAMMGDESSKSSETEEEMKSRVDSYIKRLNISAGIPSEVVDASYAQKTPDSSVVGESFAGPIPISLLARQDLETVKSFRIAKEGSDHELTVEIHNGSEETAKAVFEGCEMEDISKLETYQGHDIFVTPEMQDTDGHRIGCHVVIGQDGSLQVFFSLKDARDFIDSVLVMNKGQVESTQKDLIDMAQTAKEGEWEETDLVRAITDVQIKRQKATLAERSKESLGKGFKDTWGVINKRGRDR